MVFGEIKIIGKKYVSLCPFYGVQWNNMRGKVKWDLTKRIWNFDKSHIDEFLKRHIFHESIHRI